MVRPWYWPKGGMPERTEPFTWIMRGKMAASWWPDPPLIKIYEREGIKVIINVSEFDNHQDIPEGFLYYHIGVPDYGVPTDRQIEQFLEISNRHQAKNEPIVVHCVAGCGRTGQFIVAWGAYNGIIPKNMDPVKWIRNYRRCSLETKEQMSYARKVASKFKKN